MKIVIPDKLLLTISDREKLQQYPGIEIFDDIPTDPEIIIDRIKDAEIITANYIDITEEIIKSSKNLKYIISPATGYDWIDVKTASEQGIKVINCPTFNTYAVAEHAIALIFSVYRRIVESQLAILKGEWAPKNFVGHEVRGKKLLTIGYGHIGKLIHQSATGLGMDPDYINTSSSEAEINQKIQDTDIVVLCLPLNDKTKGLFNAERIASLKQSAIIINVARGLIVDQNALYIALKEKKIWGAGLDVFNRDENLRSGREDIIKFAQLPNVVTTSHIGFNTVETQERFGTELLNNIEAILTGNPINVVN